MNRNKWDEFGGGIDDIIQKAINSGNYNSLGRDVNDLIKKATYTFEDALNKGLNEARNRTVKTNLGGNTVEVNKSYQDSISRPDTKKKEIITSKDNIYIRQYDFGTGIGKCYIRRLLYFWACTWQFHNFHIRSCNSFCNNLCTVYPIARMVFEWNQYLKREAYFQKLPEGA